MTDYFIDLTEYGLVKIFGHEAKKFLQGQLTCQMDDITPTIAAFAAHCNPQGRVISLFNLIQRQQDYYLVLRHDMVAITITALKKYAVFFKVEIIDATHTLKIIAYKGDKNQIFLADISKIELPNQLILLIGDNDSINACCAKILPQASYQDLNTWRLNNIHAKIPTIYPTTSGKFLPHEIDLPQLNAINFAKGCYTGQEIIARMHYRGKLKTHLYQAQIRSKKNILPGMEVCFLQNQQENTCGNIVDVAHLADNDYHVLLVTDESQAKNQHLFLPQQANDFFIINSFTTDSLPSI